MKSVRIMTLLLGLLVAVSMVARASTDDMMNDDMMMDADELLQLNVAQIAVSNDDLTTLVAALQEAGLVDDLMGPGPFTVFAPTNEAFAKLPDGTLDALMADPEQLQQVLLYHVVADDITSNEIPPNQSEAMTLQGTDLELDNTFDDGIYVNETAKVTEGDIVGNNGVIHIIDTVLVPMMD